MTSENLSFLRMNHNQQIVCTPQQRNTKIELAPVRKKVLNIGLDIITTILGPFLIDKMFDCLLFSIGIIVATTNVTLSSVLPHFPQARLTSLSTTANEYQYVRNNYISLHFYFIDFIVHMSYMCFYIEIAKTTERKWTLV